MKAIHILLLVVVLMFVAEPAFACAVCFDANDESRGAFLGTTILLSLMPLAMIGGLVYWVWRRSKAQDKNLPSPG